MSRIQNYSVSVYPSTYDTTNSSVNGAQKSYKKISGRWIEQTDPANVFIDGNVYVGD